MENNKIEDNWYNAPTWWMAILAFVGMMVGAMTWVYALSSNIQSVTEKLEKTARTVEKHDESINSLKTDSAVIREKLSTIERVVLKIEKKL